MIEPEAIRDVADALARAASGCQECPHGRVTVRCLAEVVLACHDKARELQVRGVALPWLTISLESLLASLPDEALAEDGAEPSLAAVDVRAGVPARRLTVA